jgi:Tfp pilus assembly protein PilE
MTPRGIIERIRSDESGFTLVELCVVMLVSIVIVIALLTYQDIVLRQTTRVFASVDATQRGRTTMETIENRLRSSCMAEDVIPIQVGSSDSSLSFVSRYGSAASLTPEKHTISFNATSGLLTDTIYQVSGGSSPNWTFSATPSSTVTMLDHVTQVPGTPIFRYYRYDIARDSGGNSYLDAAGSPYMILLDGAGTLPTGTTTSTGGPVPANTIPANSPSPLPAPNPPASPAGLTAANANITAAVSITFKVGAAGGLGNNATYSKAPVTVQNSVVLRLTPVPSEGNLPTVPPCA